MSKEVVPNPIATKLSNFDRLNSDSFEGQQGTLIEGLVTRLFRRPHTYYGMTFACVWSFHCPHTPIQPRACREDADVFHGANDQDQPTACRLELEEMEVHILAWKLYSSHH
jgi:hypothetical protein